MSLFSDSPHPVSLKSGHELPPPLPLHAPEFSIPGAFRQKGEDCTGRRSQDSQRSTSSPQPPQPLPQAERPPQVLACGKALGPAPVSREPSPHPLNLVPTLCPAISREPPELGSCLSGQRCSLGTPGQTSSSSSVGGGGRVASAPPVSSLASRPWPPGWSPACPPGVLTTGPAPDSLDYPRHLLPGVHSQKGPWV